MIFNTYWFVCFSAVFFPGYWLLIRPEFRKAWLLAGCGIFHFHFAGPAGVAPIIAIGAVTYLAALTRSRALCATGIIVCVAALCFYWPAIDRQVRIEGAVERTTDAEADAYFTVRPLGSRIGAIASPQSRPLASRAELEAKLDEVTAALAGAEPARPSWWGGYRVVPEAVEFWQGQPSRLHDRVQYTLDATGVWSRQRLAP